MPFYGSAGFSENTPLKQQHFGIILEAHAEITKAILRKYPWATPYYLYFDMNAGPGLYPDNTSGSPIISTDVLQHLGMPFCGYCVEDNQATYERLCHTFRRVYAPYEQQEAITKYLIPENGRVLLHHSPSHKAVEDFLALLKTWPYSYSSMYGLVYHDPNGYPEFETLQRCADTLPRTDILIHCQANIIKRCFHSPRHPSYDKRLDQLMQSIKKDYWLIREPYGRDQWTFLLGTNWTDFPEFRTIGFYKTASHEGKRILQKLSLKSEEYEALLLQQPKEDEQESFLPYRTYAEYLKHPRFLAIRQQVVHRAKGRCEYKNCGKPMSEVHHLIYPPWGTFDVPSNMIAICHACHCRIHGKTS